MNPTSYELEVTAVTDETADAKSISFTVPAHAREAFTYRPGQFLTLAVPSDQTGTVARCYSLSSSPLDTDTLTVTVKRTPDGYGSNWVCDHLSTGSSIRALPPSGLFTPASLDDDLLLLAAGSGITPLMSIIRTVLRAGQAHISLLYANRDTDSVIFADQLAQLSASHPDRLSVTYWLESVRGRPTHDQLRTFAVDHTNRDAFICGPGPFMELANAALTELGLPRRRRHREKFLSLSGNPFGDARDRIAAEQELRAADAGAHTETATLPSGQALAPGEKQSQRANGTGPADPALPAAAAAGAKSAAEVEIELDGAIHVYDDWPCQVPLLEFLESKGLTPPYSCREGECSSCAVRLLDGEVTMKNNDVLDDDDLADGIRLACQARPTTNVIRAVYD